MRKNHCNLIILGASATVLTAIVAPVITSCANHTYIYDIKYKFFDFEDIINNIYSPLYCHKLPNVDYSQYAPDDAGMVENLNSYIDANLLMNGTLWRVVLDNADLAYSIPTFDLKYLHVDKKTHKYSIEFFHRFFDRASKQCVRSKHIRSLIGSDGLPLGIPITEYGQLSYNGYPQQGFISGGDQYYVEVSDSLDGVDDSAPFVSVATVDCLIGTSDLNNIKLPDSLIY